MKSFLYALITTNIATLCAQEFMTHFMPVIISFLIALAAAIVQQLLKPKTLEIAAWLIEKFKKKKDGESEKTIH